MSKNANLCDWWMSSTLCVASELPLEKYQKEDCNKMAHHLHQNTWHASIEYESSTISKYCQLHDTIYQIMHLHQAQAEYVMVPFQNNNCDIFYSSTSQDEDDAIVGADDAVAAVDADTVSNNVENANNDADDDMVDTTAKTLDNAEVEDIDDDEYDSGDD